MKRDSSASPPRADQLPPLYPPLPPLFGGCRALSVAVGVLLATNLFIFGDLLFSGGDRILSLAHQDIYTVFVGWYEFTFGEMARGNLPLWNPHLFGGAPCLGGFQEALLYPPSWLHLVMPLPQAINCGIALHVFLAGLFTYMWTARRGLHPAAAIAAGLVFMFGGAYFMDITAGHIPNLQTMVWTPLIFLAIDDLTTTRSLRGAWVGSAAVAMQILAGHPQYVYYTALCAVPYTLIGLWNAPSRRGALAGLALMGIGGAALSAMQLFTGLQAAGESLRSQLPIDVAGTFPFAPENLLTVVLPAFFGDVPHGLYWGRWLLWEDSIFIGCAALALAIFGAIRGDKKFRPLTITAFALVSLLVALGSATPIYKLLYHVLPGFNSFRGVSKVIFLTALFLAYLVGVGFDKLLTAPRISRRPPIIIATAAVALVAAGLFISISGNSGMDGSWGRMLQHINFSAEAYQHGAMAKRGLDAAFFHTSAHVASVEMLWRGGACAALAMLWWAATLRRKFAFGIIALLAVELLTFAWTNCPTFSRSEIAMQEVEMRQRLDRIGPDARIISNDPSIVLGAGGLEGWGNDPMLLRRYAQFLALQLSPSPDVLPKPSGTWAMMRIRLVQSPGDNVWHVLTRPLLPRAQLVENIRVIEDPQKMLAAIGDPHFDYYHTVLLEKPSLAMPASPSAPKDGPPGVVEIKDLPGETDDIEITADVRRSCILLISDNYSTGWHTLPLPDAPAQKYDVIPADHTLRGIPLNAGRHHFILEYRPTAYVIGKWVTVIAILGWLAAGMMLSGWVRLKSATIKSARPTSGKKSAR